MDELLAGDKTIDLTVLPDDHPPFGLVEAEKEYILSPPPFVAVTDPVGVIPVVLASEKSSQPHHSNILYLYYHAWRWHYKFYTLDSERERWIVSPFGGDCKRYDDSILYRWTGVEATPQEHPIAFLFDQPCRIPDAPRTASPTPETSPEESSSVRQPRANSTVHSRSVQCRSRSMRIPAGAGHARFGRIRRYNVSNNLVSARRDQMVPSNEVIDMDDAGSEGDGKRNKMSRQPEKLITLHRGLTGVRRKQGSTIPEPAQTLERDLSPVMASKEWFSLDSQDEVNTTRPIRRSERRPVLPQKKYRASQFIDLGEPAINQDARLETQNARDMSINNMSFSDNSRASDEDYTSETDSLSCSSTPVLRFHFSADTTDKPRHCHLDPLERFSPGTGR